MNAEPMTELPPPGLQPTHSRAGTAPRLHVGGQAAQHGRGPSLQLALSAGCVAAVASFILSGQPGIGPPTVESTVIRSLLVLTGIALLGWYAWHGQPGGTTPEEPGVRTAGEAAALLALAITAVALVMGFREAAELGAHRWLGGVGLTGALATVGTYYVPRIVARSAPSAVAKRVIIVGSGPRAVRAARELEAEHELLGFVDSNPHPMEGSVERRKIGTLEDLEAILMKEVVDEVVIALPVRSQYSQIQRAIHVCEACGTESKYLADIFDSSLARPRFEGEGPRSVIAMKVTIDERAARVKRTLDVLLASLLLLLVAPLMLLIAAAIKLSSDGPVLYRQERFGQHKRRFRMLKFRTMVSDAETLQVSLEALNECSGPVFKIRADPRITPLGRFLRRSSLDELPQLLNVLAGEMSLVGPRPLPTRDVMRFTEPWLMRRFSAPPGITGVWQVSGRSEVQFADWVRMDLQYIDGWSLALDLRILARTVPAVLSGRGAQ
jgi:exopolysaccharide biosynthesis polyprenyl glycosylphosphotransferase